MSLTLSSEGHIFQLSVGVGDLKQKSWHQLRAFALANLLVEGAVNDIDRTCLLVSSTKELEPGCMLFPFLPWDCGSTTIP